MARVYLYVDGELKPIGEYSYSENIFELYRFTAPKDMTPPLIPKTDEMVSESKEVRVKEQDVVTPPLISKIDEMVSESKEMRMKEHDHDVSLVREQKDVCEGNGCRSFFVTYPRRSC